MIAYRNVLSLNAKKALEIRVPFDCWQEWELGLQIGIDVVPDVAQDYILIRLGNPGMEYAPVNFSAGMNLECRIVIRCGFFLGRECGK